MDKRRIFYWLGIVAGFNAAVGGGVFFLRLNEIAYINPNAWATFPLTGLFAICLGFFFHKEDTRGRVILFLLAAVNLVWIFLSGSRGNILIALLCLIFLIIEARKISWISLITISLLVTGYLVTQQFLEQQSYALGRIERMFDTDFTLSERTSGRSELAQAGLEIFLENPFGAGTGSFADVVATTVAFRYRTIAAHSGWIKILAENGVIGIFLFSLFVFSYAAVGWKKRRQGLLSIGLLVSSVLALGFLSKELQGKSLWFLCACGASVLHRDMLTGILEKVTRHGQSWLSGFLTEDPPRYHVRSR